MSTLASNGPGQAPARSAVRGIHSSDVDVERHRIVADGFGEVPRVETLKGRGVPTVPTGLLTLFQLAFPGGLGGQIRLHLPDR